MGNAFLNSESSHFSDIQAFNLILLGILYLTVRILSGLSQYIQLTVVLGLLFYFLGEAIAGFGQIHDFVAPRHLIAQMSGSFQNSESYDGLLACLLPLSLSLALRANDAPSKRYLVVPVLSGFCTFLVLTLIPASMNPCCWFIAGIGCYVVVLYHSGLSVAISYYYVGIRRGLFSLPYSFLSSYLRSETRCTPR